MYRQRRARPVLPECPLARPGPPAPLARRNQRFDIRVPDGETSEFDKLEVGEFFKVMYYSEINPAGHEQVALIKKTLPDCFMVHVNNDWRTFLNHRIRRASPVCSDNAAPLTRSAPTRLLSKRNAAI